MPRDFFTLLLFDVVNSIVTSSVTSLFEEAWTFCYTYFHFIRDPKSTWTNVVDKIVSFTVIVNSFKGRHAVFIMFDEWMVDPLTFLICIVMKLFCEFISLLWNCVMNTEKVLLCDNVHLLYTFNFTSSFSLRKFAGNITPYCPERYTARKLT
jgi:hypothetical protein